MVSLIFALDPDRVIGRNNDLPWHYPEDLRRFRALTLHHQVVMGRRTFESILARNGRPLPGRENVVLSHAPLALPGVTVIHDLASFLTAPRHDEVFVIGGKSVFEQAWPFADRLYVTHVKKSHPGDVVLDCYTLDGFDRIAYEDGPELAFAVYERKPHA